MYSTCLFCTKDLGTNDVVETLPIGRRIAFDAAQGRLWVVCRHCAKWNLVPFDTRLETIDAAERLFHDTRMRYSTDNIGLARLREGLELVRIGPAQRPEFAAWRYGDSFGKRRRRNLLIAAGAGAAGIGVIAGGAALGISLASIAQLPNAFNLIYNSRRVAVRVPRLDAPPIEISPMQATQARIVAAPDAGWAIRTKVLEPGRPGSRFRKQGKIDRDISGPAAEQLLAGILGRVNQYTGTQAQVRAAVERVEARPEVDALVFGGGQPTREGGSKRLIGRLPADFRLAMEMLLNEEKEREALAGELKLLEWQWKEAERLARIADGMVLDHVELPPR